MTKEESIKVLTQYIDYDAETPDYYEMEKACKVALKVLKQEPCEDCISREEVCDYIAEFVNHEYATDRERELVKNIIGGIQHLPSIQPTTKENLVVEDCISRKAVLDALNKWDWQELYLPVHFKDIIDDLPSIQPKPMQVELEGDGYSDGQLVYDYGKCPKCGWEFEYGEKDWEEPYCCHCGQKLHWFESEEEE